MSVDILGHTVDRSFLVGTEELRMSNKIKNKLCFYKQTVAATITTFGYSWVLFWRAINFANIPKNKFMEINFMNRVCQMHAQKAYRAQFSINHIALDTTYMERS